jgi:predicted Zn-dependent peptidase
VREKLSLCYFASSAIDRLKGVMIVSSGIEFSKYDEALSEILAQLEAVKRGDVNDNELDGARKAISTHLKTASDDLHELENFYLDNVLSGLSFSPEEMAALIQEVSLENIIKIASGIKLDTVYFLKGAPVNAES